jgi:hypothetical protein
METFSLQDLFFLLGMCALIGLVSALGPPIWRGLPRLRDRYFERQPIGDLYRYIMSTDERFEDDDRPLYANNSPAATTPQPATTALQSDATYSKGLLDGQARALAIAVKAGKIGETEGLKMIFGVSPSSTNQKYITARAALKAELEKLNNPYPRRTAEQQQLREELGLQKP